MERNDINTVLMHEILKKIIFIDRNKDIYLKSDTFQTTRSGSCDSYLIIY